VAVARFQTNPNPPVALFSRMAARLTCCDPSGNFPANLSGDESLASASVSMVSVDTA
jgi:hypothetical protein